MDYSVNRQKMEQTVSYLTDFDIDAWLILTSEGSDPCLPLVTGVGTVGPGAFIITKDGGKYALCSGIDAQDIVESSLFDEVIPYSMGLESSLQELIERLKPEKMALNYSVNDHLADGLTTGRYRWLLKTLEGSFHGEIVSSEPYLILLRSIKTEKEIERIKQAVDTTLEIFDEVFGQVHTGLTEKDVGQLFVKAMEKRNVLNGVDRTLSMPIVMKERIAHRAPGDAVIEPGDLVIVDFSVENEGYVSDIARTVYFLKEGETKAPEEVQKVFAAIHQAISEAAKELRPGVQGWEVDAVARNSYLKKGLPEITHATGHQIGRDVHDGGALLGPKWARYGDAPYQTVKEGMVFTLEPTVFLDNGIHFIVEENVLVTDEGVEFLTKRQSDLILISPH